MTILLVDKNKFNDICNRFDTLDWQKNRQKCHVNIIIIIIIIIILTLGRYIPEEV